MKKVLILHGENTFNYGTFMMLINYIYYNSKKEKDLEYVVRLNSKEDYTRLIKEINNKKIKITFFKYKKQVKYLSKVDKIIGLKHKFFDNLIELKKMNLNKIIILGGDDLSEYYKGWRISSDLIQLKLFKLITDVNLISQTIGPFYSWRKNLARFCFKDMYINCRDSTTYDYLIRDLKLNNVSLSKDLAFFDLPLQKANFYFKKLKLKKRKYVVIVPSGLWNKYTPDYGQYIKAWVKIVKNILRIKHLKKHKILFLAHVIKPENTSDSKVINDICNKINKKRIIKIIDPMLASDARSLIGASKFVLTGRMHPAISALQTGVTPIAISYSVKYDRILGKDSGLKDLIINGKCEWDEKIISKIMKKIKKVF